MNYLVNYYEEKEMAILIELLFLNKSDKWLLGRWIWLSSELFTCRIAKDTQLRNQLLLFMAMGKLNQRGI